MASVLERGDITFFYRPTVQAAGATRVAPGIQSFFFILSPARRHFHRRVRVGRKRMPAPTGERCWAIVERAGAMQRVLGDLIESETYITKTRGERYQPGARPIAQGCYAFVQHEDHTHLVYRVDLAEPDVPAELELPEAASHLVLFERLDRTRGVWTTGGVPARFDTEGEELVLVGVDLEPERDLGIEVLPAAPSWS
jgi:hypothetical protein